MTAGSFHGRSFPPHCRGRRSVTAVAMLRRLPIQSSASQRDHHDTAADGVFAHGSSPAGSRTRTTTKAQAPSCGVVRLFQAVLGGWHCTGRLIPLRRGWISVRIK